MGSGAQLNRADDALPVRGTSAGGGAPGMSGALYQFIDSGYTVIALANRDSGTAESIANFVIHRLPAK
jgi:hypothetical protein